MMAISLGSLALPTAPLLVLLALLVAQWAAHWVAMRQARRSAGPASAASDPSPPGPRLTQALLVGLLLARLAHVGLHHEAYLVEPWSALDLRDGGWQLWAGLAGGLAWLALQARRHARQRRALAAGAAAGLALWAAGLLALAQMTPRTLPDLVLTDLATGQAVRLQALAAGRPLVLNLWASWCGPCRREMPVLVAAQAREPDVLFVFANQGEDAEAVRRYLRTQGLAPAQVLLDPQARLGPALGSAGLPTTVFINRQGQRVDAHLGALNAAALASRVEALRR